MSIASQERVGASISPPDQIHVAREQLSPWRSSGRLEAPPSPSDIEAAMGAATSLDKRTWTGYQSSETLWTEAAVEKSQASTFIDRDNDSKFSHSVAPSLRDIHTSHSGISQVAMINDEKVPSVPSLPTASGPSLSFPHQIALVVVCCLAQFLNLGAMNQTVAPVMILADYFDIRDYGTLSWFSAAYSMCVGTFILPAGEYHNLLLLYNP
jgi:hypothetical protein